MQNNLRHGHAVPRHRTYPHHFLAAWIRSPLKMGAILPSSRGLARAMASGIDINKPGVIIELGAGTGVVTHALLKTGISPERLLVIERDERMHAVLSSQFHHVNVLRADAMHLDEVLAQAGVTQVNAIVSSLPLASMPKLVREAIEQQMIALIGEHGQLIQFTYSTKSPIHDHRMSTSRLYGKRVKLVVANVPPAHVWVYRSERRKAPRK